MEAYRQLEQEFAHFNNLDPAGMVACSSGTAALHLALEALQLPQGSEVLCPDYTMVACARAITLAGLTPVFVDCRDDLLVDGDLLKNLDWEIAGVGRWVQAAAMLVHVYGRRCSIPQDVLDRPNVKVVEDIAEAHGVRPHPQTDAACWSFYKNKIIAGEEGGAVWFRSPDRAKLARQLRTLGFTDTHDFVHVPRGHNYRMSNAHAKLILQNLKVASVSCVTKDGAIHDGGLIGARRQIEKWYDDYCPGNWGMPPRQAPWVYDLRIPGLTRQRQAEIVRKLNAEGIEARMGFWPMSRQPEYLSTRWVGYGRREECGLRLWGSAADKAADEVFYLPICTGKTTEESCKRSFEVIESALC